jgi:predicted ribosome quality control (RQC) complex YloA/Tae2 family protein
MTNFTRNQIYTLIQQLKNKIVGSKVQSLRELAPCQWILTLEREKRIFHLLFSLKMPFLRFHLLSNIHKSKDSPVTKSWESLLKQGIIEHIEMVENDRILKISFQSHGIKHLIAEFFPQRPNLYLLDQDRTIMLSLNSTKNIQYAPPENPKNREPVEIDPEVTHQSIESKYDELEKEYAFDTLRSRIRHELEQRLKKVRKAKEKIHASLDQCRQWPELYHEARLLQANMFSLRKGLNEITVLDWEKNGESRVIQLDSHSEPKEEVLSRFKKVKKLRAGVEPNEKILKKTENIESDLLGKLAQLEPLTSLNDLVLFEKTLGLKSKADAPSPQEKQKLPFYEFKSEKGLKIWVGKNAQANEKLTFSYAKGSDFWLHVDGMPGSHIILCVEKNQQPDPESIDDALHLAIAYSKAKNEGAADVCVTQRKYVSRLGKSAAGKVQISKHKILYTKLDRERVAKIKARE